MLRFAPVRLVIALILLSSVGWTQRTGGARTSAPRTVPDPGRAYGVTPTGPPPEPGRVYTRHAEEEQKVEFKSETVLVQVPAVVTDKSGDHIHKLTKEDFQIFENGKPQTIAAFEEVTAASLPLVAPSSKPDEFSNLMVDPKQPRTLTVVAIDTINTPFLDQAYGRRELIKYLSTNLDQGQILGLVMIGSKGVTVLHKLTSDPAQLISAVKKVNGEIPAMQSFGTEAQVTAASGSTFNNPAGNMSPITPSGDNNFVMADIVAQLNDFMDRGDAIEASYQQDRAVEMTLRAFLNIAWSVSGIPGRKALVWATGSFPFAIDTPSSVPGGYLTLLYERTMQALNDAEVSIYPVDVRGLVANSPTADATYAGGKTGPQMMRAVVGRSWLQASTIDTLRDFAAMTGGRAFYNSNDLAGSFHKAASDASSYYVLGYYLDTHNDKPGWRQLKVKVNKPGSEVRARTGFFVTNATMNPGVTRKLDEDFALNSPFDATSIPITVRFLGNAPDGDKRKVNFSVNLPGNGILIDQSAQNRFSFDFAAIVTKGDGSDAGKVGQTMEGTIKPEALGIVKEQGVSFKKVIDLVPGKYNVRLIVRDNLTGKLGSVTAPLTVN